ncbi:MAG TPA: DNA topoisomerase IB [Casimicrobiaceae bacterium]|nr:DNA topoisomerase IB [Casimicrobiaceae bacterium]
MSLDTASVTEPPSEPIAEVLESTGLRYVSAAMPGIKRIGSPPRFRYLGPSGSQVTDEKVLARIAKLVLPPAWTDVWITTDPRGHLQATGRDVRGRKQYRYHNKWREERDSNKFDRLAAFGRALPKIRTCVARDLGLSGLPREKVLATMVSLLDRIFVRVGDERYRKANGSYGLTTLRDKHVEISGESIRIRFRGKSGKEHDVALSDRRIANIVRRCRELPGYELFQYVEEGEAKSIDATDVNGYLKVVANDDYSAKDFRTWHATVIAANALAIARKSRSGRASPRAVNDAIRKAAESLGNTLAVCRRSYVHPGVLDIELLEAIEQRRGVRVAGLSAEERRVLTLLAAAARRKPDQELARKLERSIAATRRRPKQAIDAPNRAKRALRRRAEPARASG